VIGATFTGSFGSTDAGTTYFVQSTARAAAGYVVPVGGRRIIRYSVRGSDVHSVQLQLAVMRKSRSGDTWTVVALSSPVAMRARVLNTCGVSIPVKPGDRLGLTNVSGGAPIYRPGFTTRDQLLTVRYAQVGQTFTPTGPAVEGVRLNVSAVVVLRRGARRSI
jgi:hypothetical protein